jgi:hypothetical protein
MNDDAIAMIGLIVWLILWCLLASSYLVRY